MAVEKKIVTMCVAKRYIVKLEMNGEFKSEVVTEKSPVRARRVILREYEKDTKIIFVCPSSYAHPFLPHTVI